MRTIRQSRFLAAALATDATTSAVIALVQLAAVAALAAATDLPHALIAGTGAFCAVYALLLAGMVRAPTLPTWLVAFVGFGNLGWAASAVALSVSGIVAANAAGHALLALHAVGTVVFGVWQLVGLARSRAAGALSPA